MPSLTVLGGPPTHRFHPWDVRMIPSMWKVRVPYPKIEVGPFLGSAPASSTISIDRGSSPPCQRAENPQGLSISQPWLLAMDRGRQR